MSGLSVYLLSIVGVVIISVVLDLIIPSGQISKYIKGIMSLVIIFVIASPLPNLVKNGFNFSMWNSNAELDEGYLETVKNQYVRTLEEQLENQLKQEGITGAVINVWGDLENGKIKITYIFVEMKNVVLSDKKAHIDKYEAIKSVLINYTGIGEEQVVFDG